MQAAAFVSDMGTSEAPYLNEQGLPQPDKVIRNTATLSAYNLQELKKRLTQSTMYALYSSMVKSPVRPVLLDTGASACTSPFKDAFVDNAIHPLTYPITLQGIDGGMEILPMVDCFNMRPWMTMGC
jgi:hypothetical protein